MLTCVSLILLFLALLICLAQPVSSAALRINVGGPSISSIGFGADLPKYLTSSGTAIVKSSSPIISGSSWKPVFSTYRYAFKGNLEYNIPIPPGLFKVSLLFAETWPGAHKKSARIFQVVINGETFESNFDIYSKIGANKPLFLRFPKISSVQNFITITLVRIPDAENPLLSGIVIIGDNPSALIDQSSEDNVPNQPPKTTSTNPDPKCSTGIFGINKSTGQMACCEKVCGQCGGTDCHKFATGKLCCISNVVASAPSCNTAPPPCVPATDLSVDIDTSAPCKLGIFGSGSKGAVACCPDVCKKCGGTGCGKFAPGNLCCVKAIFNLNKPCDTNLPPCVPSQAPAAPKKHCEKGILGQVKKKGIAACCPDACKKCGGPGCLKFAPGNKCCIMGIYKTGLSCATNDPPCVPDDSSTEPPTTLPPTTTESTPLEPEPEQEQEPQQEPQQEPEPEPEQEQEPESEPEPEPPSGTCPITGATKSSFNMNIGGGVIPDAVMGADNINYVSSKVKGHIFSKPSLKISAPEGPQSWDTAYTSHRFTESSVLTYDIPVPNGKYTVQLLFCETYFKKIGERVFDLFVNGVEKKSNLDIFDEVGINKGLLLSFANTGSVRGKITISMIKVIENPMISAIMIAGTGAGGLASGGGCKFLDDGTKGDKFNGGFNHRAHAVPGGPYISTDFSKEGRALVSLDATQSHSHFSDPGPPPVTGKIVAYKWKWNEKVDGKSVPMSNSDKSGMFTSSFPLGKTKINLEVVDNTGDVATDKTVVEVKDSAANGAYCYFYDFKDQISTSIPIGMSVNSDPKPFDGASVPTINFNGRAKLSMIKIASNSLAIRCVFFISVENTQKATYTVAHNGPFKLYHKNALIASSKTKGKTSTPPTSLTPGLHAFQLHYFSSKTDSLLLSLSQGQTIVPSSILQHDSSITLPVITGLSKSKSAPSGGENIQIYGSGFINGVSVKFGKTESQNLISSHAGMVQVTVPPGKGAVSIVVSTNAGSSNNYPFVYTSPGTLDQPVIFEKTHLKDVSGENFDISFVASVRYGPDGRLYLGGTKGEITALSVDRDLTVTSKCVRRLKKSTAILGLAFKPTSTSLKMYFSASTMYWKDFNLLNFEEGWTNGKIQSILWSSKYVEDKGKKQSCAGDIVDVITGLPVSNHDHGINQIKFLPNGNLLISIGGFTNGGISTPGKKPVSGDVEDDALGGVSDNPLSSALVECPVDVLTEIKYDNYEDPQNAKVVEGDACKLYATGLRNSFGLSLHSNGRIYLMDNGPNAGFGDFSIDCTGKTKKGKNISDKFFLVEKGKFHGHPNLNRKECEHYPPSAVQPLIKNVKSSSAGIMEYRSNTFGGQIKGNLFLSMFAAQFEGQLGQVKLSDDGKSVVSYAPNFLGFSGVAVTEGPRGEIIMARVYKNFVVIAKPKLEEPKVTFLIGVHPKKGPSKGGAKVLISGFNFGPNPTAKFGDKFCTGVNVIDDQSFTCSTPPNSKNEQVVVIVTGSMGESPIYGTDYWYW